MQPSDTTPATRRLPAIRIGELIIIGLLLAFGITTFVLAYDIFFAGLLGVLFGVLLHEVACSITKRLSFSYNKVLAGLIAGLILLALAVVWLFGSTTMQQIDGFKKQFNEAVVDFREMSQKKPWLGDLVNATPPLKRMIHGNPDDLPGEAADALTSSSGVLGAVPSNVAQVTSTTLGIIVNTLLIFFMGVFIASNPGLYRRGLLHLAAVPNRDRYDGLLDRLGNVIYHWAIGRGATMLITGLGTAIALWLLGLPAAFAVGVLTGLLAFIPNVGPLIGFSVACLIAIPQGMSMVLWVAVVFVGFQLLESYVLTPVIQKKQVDVAPALLLFTQAVLGVTFGLMGALIAEPALAIGRVLLQQLYRRDVLHDPELNGAES